MGTDDLRDPNLRTRRSDHPWKRRLRMLLRENWYRDVWLLIITGLVLLALNSQSDTAGQARHTAGEADHTAGQARRLAREIEAQRVTFVRRGCDTQNKRHDATINALNALYRKPQPPFALRGVNPAIASALNLLVAQQRASSRAPTILLIDALVPKQNCTDQVKAALGVPKRGLSAADLQRAYHLRP